MYDTKDMVKYKPTPGSGFRVTGRKKDAVRYKGDYLNLPELEAQLVSVVHREITYPTQCDTQREDGSCFPEILAYFILGSALV